MFFPASRPVLTSVQFAQAFLERKTPPPVPAKRLVPEMTRARTERFVKPLFSGAQLVPSFVDTNTPALDVPTKRFAPETRKH